MPRPAVGVETTLRRRMGSSSVRDRLTTLSRGYWRFVRKHHPSLGAALRPRAGDAVVAGDLGWRSQVLHTINASGGLYQTARFC